MGYMYHTSFSDPQRAVSFYSMGVLLRLPVYTPEPVEVPSKPVTRADCLPGGINGARPCPWVSCIHNIREAPVSFIPIKYGPTCALDVADLNGVTLEEVGTMMGVTRERIRQIEEKALRKLARRGLKLGISLRQYLRD